MGKATKAEQHDNDIEKMFRFDPDPKDSYDVENGKYCREQSQAARQ